ncbi:glycoside hydrolase family 114 protein, partial [Glonium stellatum]
PDAPVFDVDMHDTDIQTIAGLKTLGKIVVCYFSAGTYEPWRDDAGSFLPSDLGLALEGWPDERWLKLSSPNVRSIMTARIKRAAGKGCDAIDPDNTDGYSNKNGLNLQKNDSIDFIKFLASTASSQGLQIGLKNSLEIIPDVMSLVQFAVNEQCALNVECDDYNDFTAAGKPVFHIEYPNKIPQVPDQDRKNDCQGHGIEKFSTVLKNKTLNGWVEYCDGSSATT